MITSVLHPLASTSSSSRAGEILTVVLVALSLALTMVTLASA